jgi:PAS domain S-box-containing protein
MEKLTANTTNNKYLSVFNSLITNNQIGIIHNALLLIQSISNTSQQFIYCYQSDFIISTDKEGFSIKKIEENTQLLPLLFYQTKDIIEPNTVLSTEKYFTPASAFAKVFIGINLQDTAGFAFGKLVLQGDEVTVTPTLIEQLHLLNTLLKSIFCTQLEKYLSEYSYQFHVDNGPLAIIEWDANFTIKNWSKKAIEIFGWQVEEVRSKHYTDFTFVSNHTLEKFSSTFTSLLTNNINKCTIECTNFTKDSIPLNCRWYLSASRNTEGNILSIFSMIENITALKNTQQDLQQSEERFSLAVEGSSDGIWDWHVQEDMAYFSPRFRELVGYPAVEYIAGIAALKESVHEDDLEGTLLAIEQHFIQKKPFEREHRLKMVTGGYRWFLVRGQAIWNTAGEPIRMAGSLTDIQQKKEAEDKLLQTNKALVENKIALDKINKLNTAILTALPDAMFKLSYDGYFTDYFTQDEAALLISPAQFLGKNVTDVLPTEVSTEVYKAIKAVSTTKKPYAFTYKLVVQETEKFFEGRLTFINDAEYLCIVRDISIEKIKEKAILNKTELLNGLTQIALVALQEITWSQLLKQTTKIIGDIYKCSRVLYFENYVCEKDKKNYGKIHTEWVKEGFNSQMHIEALTKINFTEHPLFWEPVFSGHAHTVQTKNEKNIFIQQLLSSMGNKAILIMPIFVHNKMIGVLGLDECTYEREWTEEEKDTLQSIINILKLNYQKSISNSKIEKLNERYEFVMKATNDLIWDWDFVNNTIERSENGFKKLTGYDYSEVKQTFEFWPNHMHPDDAIASTEDFKKALDNATQFYWEYEFRFLQKNGNYAYVIDRCYILRDKTGQAIRAIGATQNITQQKNIAIELKNNEQLFRSMIQNISDIITLVDVHGTILYESDSIKHVLGYQADELIGKNIMELMHPDDIENVAKVFLHCVQHEGIAPMVQFKFKAKNGHYVFLESIGNNQLNNSTVQSIIVISRDITQRKKVEEAINESEIKFKSLVHNISDIISIVLPDGTIAYQSSSIKQKMGYTENELNNTNIAALIHPDDYAQVMVEFKKLIEEGKNTNTLEFRIKNKDDEYFYIEAQATNQLNNPTIKGIVINSRDVTERKKTEEERKKLVEELTKNNADLKQFTYIASHNLRAPLTNLMSMIKLLDTSTITNERTLKLIEGFKTSTYKLNDTLNDLKDILLIKNNTNLPITVTHFDTTIQKIITSIAPIIEQANAAIHYNFEKASTVLFNQAYLESIFLNLITNAIRYASNDRLAKINIYTTIKDKKTLLIISDNGTGFDMALAKDKIFGLHQKFHHHPESRGIGLYLIHSQITSLGGSITVKSIENIGTTFTIQFNTT